MFWTACFVIKNSPVWYPIYLLSASPEIAADALQMSPGYGQLL